MSSTTDLPAPLVFNATDADFQSSVIDRSHHTPVVVDLWAEWCGPCKQLGPMLERAVRARGGDVVLAKVDTETNPAVARSFQVQSIPAVFGLRDGQVVAQFVGVRPEAEIERFLDELAPSAADLAVQRAHELAGDERADQLRVALEIDPGHREAAIALAELVVESDPAEALELVRPHRPEDAAEAIATRAELAGDAAGDIEALRAQADGDDAALVDLGRALAAKGDYDQAFDRLLEAVERGGEPRDRAREQVVALFNVLGDDDPRVQAARPRLARALF